MATDFDLIKSFEVNKGVRGVGEVTEHTGEDGDAFNFDRSLEKLHKGPEFVKDLADISRKTRSFIVTANIKLDRDSYGTLFSLETEDEGNL